MYDESFSWEFLTAVSIPQGAVVPHVILHGHFREKGSIEIDQEADVVYQWGTGYIHICYGGTIDTYGSPDIVVDPGIDPFLSDTPDAVVFDQREHGVL